MAWIPEPGSGGVSDHGDLDGLADDDHTQYLNTVRHAAIDAADHGSGAATAGQVLTADGAGGAAWRDPTGGGAVAETIGDNSNTSFQVQHNLGTQDLVVQLWDLTGAEPIEATGDASQSKIDDDNNVTVTIAAAPTTDSDRMVILGCGRSTGGGGGGESNLTLGRPYTTTTAPNNVDGNSLFLGPSDSNYQATRHLTDGIRPDGTGGSFGRTGCISWQNQDPTITFDFGSSVAVTQVRVFGTAGGGGIVTPNRIIVESSPDNNVWTSRADTGV